MADTDGFLDAGKRVWIRTKRQYEKTFVETWVSEDVVLNKLIDAADARTTRWGGNTRPIFRNVFLVYLDQQSWNDNYCEIASISQRQLAQVMAEHMSSSLNVVIPKEQITISMRVDPALPKKTCRVEAMVADDAVIPAYGGLGPDSYLDGASGIPGTIPPSQIAAGIGCQTPKRRQRLVLVLADPSSKEKIFSIVDGATVGVYAARMRPDGSWLPRPKIVLADTTEGSVDILKNHLKGTSQLHGQFCYDKKLCRWLFKDTSTNGTTIKDSSGNTHSLSKGQECEIDDGMTMLFGGNAEDSHAIWWGLVDEGRS